MFTRFFNRLEEIFIAILLAAMVTVTFIQVTLRYVFGSGILWGVECTTYLFGWLVLFGASYVLKKRGHIGVDVVVKKLSSPKQRLVGLAATMLSLLYAGIFFVGGWNYVQMMYNLGIRTEDMRIQRWILLSILPIGFVLLFVRLLQLLWRIWAGKETGFYLGDQTKDEISRLDRFLAEGKRGAMT
jgi:C4-dicarboxylate transporter, DctQ subunit